MHIKGKSFTVVDIPGHSYAKESFLVRLGEAKSLVFVIDATNINSIPAVADFLYNILISRSYQQFKTPTLLALNKQDCTNAFKRVDFELFLSREMEKLKKSRKAVQDQREGVNDSLKVFLYCIFRSTMKVSSRWTPTDTSRSVR